MSTERIKALNAVIRDTLCPQLAERGFSYEASTRTFRKKVGECTQIVNIQVGVRSMEGQFTVNLGVFHPMYWLDARNSPPPDKPREFHCWERERLAVLRDTRLTKLFRPRISNPDSFIKWWLITPTDKWWPFTGDEKANAQQIADLCSLLLSRGTSWLDAKSDVAVLRESYDQVKRVPTGV